MNNTSKRIRQITDGAVITALYCVFLLISRLTGISLEYELFFVMPIPVALYAYKYDFKTAWIPGLSITLLSTFITINPLNSLIYVLPSVIIGIVYGGLLAKKNVRPILCILFMTILSFITEVLSGVILSKMLGIADIFQEIEEIMEQINNLIIKLNITYVNVSLLQSIMEGLVPSTLILISLIDAVLVYLLFNLIILKSKIFAIREETKPLQLIKAPIWLSVVYLISIPLTIVALNYFQENNQILHFFIVFEVNLNVVLTMVYIYFGLKTSALYCRAIRKIPLIILVYLLLFIFPFQYLIALLGTADSFYKLNDKIIEKYYIQK